MVDDFIWLCVIGLFILGKLYMICFVDGYVEILVYWLCVWFVVWCDVLVMFVFGLLVISLY